MKLTGINPYEIQTVFESLLADKVDLFVSSSALCSPEVKLYVLEANFIILPSMREDRVRLRSYINGTLKPPCSSVQKPHRLNGSLPTQAKFGSLRSLAKAMLILMLSCCATSVLALTSPSSL